MLNNEDTQKLIDYNKNTLLELTQQLEAYKIHLNSFKTRALFKMHILSDPTDKILACQTLINAINKDSNATDAEKIISLRNALTEDIANTFNKRRDGWGTYVLKCIATLLTLSAAHYVCKIFSSTGETIVSNIKPTQFKLDNPADHKRNTPL